VTFDDAVRAALDELPPDLATGLRNVAVVVEDENPEDPDVFGLYHGVPLPERGDVAGLPPDTISIYRRPLEAAFPDPRELRDEIRITVLHELAHYFGFDEERIAELGYD
jgi:predicted Zn-dependent protease with MMP-like domain